MAETQTLQPLSNYVRMYRRKAGFTQRELGVLVGYGYESPVSRHERFLSLPPLAVALGYEILFEAPISELFAGVYEEVNIGIEERLTDLETTLKSHGEEDVAKKNKLAFLRERKSSLARKGRATGRLGLAAQGEQESEGT